MASCQRCTPPSFDIVRSDVAACAACCLLVPLDAAAPQVRAASVCAVTCVAARHPQCLPRSSVKCQQSGPATPQSAQLALDNVAVGVMELAVGFLEGVAGDGCAQQERLVSSAATVDGALFHNVTVAGTGRSRPGDQVAAVAQRRQRAAPSRVPTVAACVWVLVLSQVPSNGLVVRAPPSIHATTPLQVKVVSPCQGCTLPSAGTMDLRVRVQVHPACVQAGLAALSLAAAAHLTGTVCASTRLVWRSSGRPTA